MRRISFLLFPFALACNPDDGSVVVDDTADTEADADTDADTDTDTDTDADSDTDVECADAIDYLDPGNGTIDVSATPTLRAWLVEAATEDLSFTLTALGGGDVAGTVASSNGGLQWTFTPDADLERIATYSWTATTCDDEATASFTTVAGPIEADSLEGNSYDIALADVTWNAPSQTVGALLLGYIDTDHILVNVDEVNETNETITTVGAMAYDDNGTKQYPCTAAIPFDPADFSGNPYFQSGPSSTVISAGGFDIDVEDFTVSGSFKSDATAINNMRVIGYMNVAGLEFQGVDACTALAFLGGGCESCPTSGDSTCVKLDVEDPTADYIDTPFDPDIDPTQDANCQ